jgi:tRNA threonylcarbamoyladenosine biosynthesis protein TsaB
VLVLSIDTCDPCGSIAVLRDNLVVGTAAHDTPEEYSSWLLPAVGDLLKRTGFRMTDIDAFAAASGPGSFTGVRVGLTTVKAWGEVYRKPIVGVSRLKSIAVEGWGEPGYVAAWFDAHRGQVFGAVYKSGDSELVRLGDEMVIAPEKFLEAVTEMTGGDRVTWASANPESLFEDAEVQKRRRLGDEFKYISGLLAGPIGALAARELASGRFSDPLGLDANYVRRSDAEIFWKGGAAHGH